MGKFQRDLLWSTGGLAIAGVSGILLNFLIAGFYDAGALGSFNQVYAAYILFSQIAVLGVHNSVLKHVAERSDARHQSTVLIAGLAVAVPISALVSSLFFLGASWLGVVLASDAVPAGVAYATPGLFLFAINKVLINSSNARRHMRAVACLQAGRFIFMLAAFGAGLALDLEARALPIMFSVAEIGTLLGALIANLDLLVPAEWSRLGDWMRIHTSYGARGFLSGLLVELNTRVDILLLGYFLSDSVVGVYSFAAILAEGFFQLLVVLRSNYNPIIVRLLAKKDLGGLQQEIRKARRIVYPAFVVLGAVAVLGYFFVAPTLVRAELAAGWMIFALLVSGIVLASGFIPFDQILLLGGVPEWHTLLILSVVLFNAVGNAVAIPLFGALGSAAATGASFVFSAVLVCLLSRRLLQVRW